MDGYRVPRSVLSGWNPRRFARRREACALLLLCALGRLSAGAQVPQLINYQGRLLSGTNLVNGSIGLSLRLFTAPGGGTPVYEDSNSVSVVDGIYSTFIGDQTNSGHFANALTNGELWVEAAVNGTALSPRERLASAAFALRAEEEDPRWAAASNAVQVQISGEAAVRQAADVALSGSVAARLDSNAWAAAGSTTNYARRTGETFSGPVAAPSFAGDGSALTNLTGAGIADGTVSNTELSAATLSNTFWRLAGNAGTVTGSHFLGTTDGAPLEIRVNNARVWRLAESGGVPSLTGGHATNSISAAAIASAIAGGGVSGEPQRVTGAYSFIGGGVNNAVADRWAVIGGGRGNLIDTFDFVRQSDYGTIAGGVSNRIGYPPPYPGNLASIGGGGFNSIMADEAVIAGGVSNEASGTAAAIAGGEENAASADYAAVGGGRLNEAAGIASTVGGGRWNRALSSYTTVGGGDSNAVAGLGSTISGGIRNSADQNYTVIGGGLENQAGGFSTTIAGGEYNTIGIAQRSAIGGGTGNTIEDYASYSVIAGGANNRVGSNVDESVVGGGLDNAITGTGLGNTIGGGQLNRLRGTLSVIAGGYANAISTNVYAGAIGGGYNNSVSNDYATVPGGHDNVAAGTNSLAAGSRAQALHDGAFVWSDNRGTAFASVTNDEFALAVTNGLRIADNLGTGHLDRIGRRYRDNSLYAWAFVTATGSLHSSFGVASVSNTAQGTYNIVLDAAAAAFTAICPAVTPELDSAPASAAALRIASANVVNGSNRFVQVFINNGNGSLTNNEFYILVTGR